MRSPRVQSRTRDAPLYSMSKLAQRLLLAFLATAMLGLALVHHFFFVALLPTHLAAGQIEVRRVDGSRLLIMVPGEFFLLNKSDRIVVRLPWTWDLKVGPILIWERASMVGVILGDAVKGDEAEEFSFDCGGVDMRYRKRGDEFASLRIPLE